MKYTKMQFYQQWVVYPLVKVPMSEHYTCTITQIGTYVCIEGVQQYYIVNVFSNSWSVV